MRSPFRPPPPLVALHFILGIPMFNYPSPIPGLDTVETETTKWCRCYPHVEDEGGPGLILEVAAVALEWTVGQ